MQDEHMPHQDHNDEAQPQEHQLVQERRQQLALYSLLRHVCFCRRVGLGRCAISLLLLAA
jgi:hypothetical protein